MQILHIPSLAPLLLLSLITFCRNTTNIRSQPFRNPSLPLHLKVSIQRSCTHHLRQHSNSPASPVRSSPDPVDSFRAPRLSESRIRAQLVVSGGGFFLLSSRAFPGPVKDFPGEVDVPSRRRNPFQYPPTPRR